MDLLKAKYHFGDEVYVQWDQAGHPTSFRARICGIRMDAHGRVDYSVIEDNGTRSDGYFESWLTPAPQLNQPQVESPANHHEAYQLAYQKRERSNLARAYLELRVGVESLLGRGNKDCNAVACAELASCRANASSLGSQESPKLCFQLSPELADGQHWTVAPTKESVAEAVGRWLSQAGTGDEITIKTCLMTDGEVSALGDI